MYVNLRRDGVSVYMIAEMTIKDDKLYSDYVARVPEVIAKYGGRYLVRGGPVTPLSGNWHPERIIVIEFETLEDVRRCFASKEYRELAPIRERSAAGKAIVVEACPPIP